VKLPASCSGPFTANETLDFFYTKLDAVQRLATGWTTERSEFESRQSQEFSLLHVVWTGSGAHPASYPLSTGSSFPGGRADGA
jgi:hypothetical protein